VRKILRRFIALVCGFIAVATAGPASTSPVISEIFYDASGSDAGLVFVELFGQAGENLDGLVLEGVNGGDGAVYKSISLGGMIPADGVFVVGDDDNGSTSVADADWIADVDFQNGPDSVVLRNATGILDAVGYGVFGSGDIFSGEGSAAPDPPAGASIGRINVFFDSDDNGVDFGVFETPTPGNVPMVNAVPLPASLWLFCSGLVFMIARRRP